MTFLVHYQDGTDTAQGLSPAIWGNCPSHEELLMGPKSGSELYENFVGAGVAATTVAQRGQYRVFGDTGSSNIASTTLQGGALTLGSDGDNEGASVLGGPLALITSGGKDMWFECRFKTSTIADSKHGIFLGLSEPVVLTATVPIAAAGTLADANFVGFHRLEADGNTLNTVYKANGITEVLVKEDAITLVADTYIKVGMKFDTNTNILTWFADGAALADTKTIPDNTGTDFPADVVMGPLFAVLNATASTPGNTNLDWWRLVQLHN